MKQPRPSRPDVRIHQARHGAWVVEVHYEGSSIRDVVGMVVHQGEALALREFTALWLADDQLFSLEREGDRVAAEHAARRRWGVPADDEDTAW